MKTQTMSQRRWFCLALKDMGTPEMSCGETPWATLIIDRAHHHPRRDLGLGVGHNWVAVMINLPTRGHCISYKEM